MSERVILQCYTIVQVTPRIIVMLYYIIVATYAPVSHCIMPARLINVVARKLILLNVELTPRIISPPSSVPTPDANTKDPVVLSGG
jgi:hypothetical protein